MDSLNLPWSFVKAKLRLNRRLARPQLSPADQPEIGPAVVQVQGEHHLTIHNERR